MKLNNIPFSNSDISRGIKLPTKVTLSLAEECGLHLGDGSMNFYSNKGFYQLRGHIIDDKKHYFERIKPLYKELYNLDVSLREMPSTGVIGFQVWSDAIVLFKHNILNLPLGRKIDFSIPAIISTNSLFFAFLRGMFDTDGCVYIENKRGKPYPRLELRTVSKQFSKEVYLRLQQAGFGCSFWECKRTKKEWNTLYGICVRGYANTFNWVKKIGSSNPKHIAKFNKIIKYGPTQI